VLATTAGRSRVEPPLAVAIAFAVLQLLQYDVLLTAWATQWLPSVSTGL
jgi:hypothetical protein